MCEKTNAGIETDAVDLAKIDWNKLTPAEFKALEDKVSKTNALLKASKPRKKREDKLVPVKLQGNVYQLKESTFTRLKNMKSEKSKQKLIEEIISKTNQIQSI